MLNKVLALAGLTTTRVANEAVVAATAIAERKAAEQREGELARLSDNYSRTIATVHRDYAAQFRELEALVASLSETVSQSPQGHAARLAAVRAKAPEGLHR